MPGRNPHWQSDALLLLRDACREAAQHCASSPQPEAAAALHDIAEAAQALAPIFAPALDQRQQQLAAIEHAVRHGRTA